MSHLWFEVTGGRRSDLERQFSLDDLVSDNYLRNQIQNLNFVRKEYGIQVFEKTPLLVDFYAKDWPDILTI
jgi:hypothetical protein